MKKLIYLTGLILFLMGSGCSDYLDEENKSSTSGADFYATQTGYEALINACYASLSDIYEPTPYMFCAGTDLFFGAHQEAPTGLTEYYTLTPAESKVADFFQVLYQSIQTCNIALYYADKTEDYEDLESRTGEARFLRAYYYFLLVQTFGDVSLVTDMTEEPITHFDRIPASEIYEFIISELETALSEIPETQSDFGRVTARAVQCMLAKIYLTRGYEDYAGPTDFNEASAYADATINNESLSVSYEDVFAYENDANDEIIFSVQYDGAIVNEDSHNWDYPWGPLVSGGDDGVNKKNILHPTEYLFTLFGEYDCRFEGTFMNVRTSPYCGWITDRNNSPVTYYYPRTAAQLADTALWRLEDPENRTDTNISPIGEHWWEETNQDDLPALKKFDRIQTTDVQYTHDIFICRLAETYLIAAEAYFQTGNLLKARDRMNEVRTRASMSGHESDMLISESEITLDFILDERARELAGEGHRWFDLKRTGKLMERTRLYNPDIKSYYDSGIDPFLGSNQHYKILRPIPTSVIALDDGDYPQNPAYE